MLYFTCDRSFKYNPSSLKHAVKRLGLIEDSTFHLQTSVYEISGWPSPNCPVKIRTNGSLIVCAIVTTIQQEITQRAQTSNRLLP